MPPPKKTPKPDANAEPLSAEQVLAKFFENLNSIRLWYRKASTTGPEVGVNVMHELVTGNISHALELAMQGKDWKEPGEI